MAHRKYDRVQETTTGTGTGALTLAGAVTKMRAFSAMLSNGDTAYVLIEHATVAEWEICLATYSAGVITRGTVVASTTGSAVAFSAGTKTVSLIAPAGKMVVEDNNGDAAVTRDLAVGGSETISGVLIVVGNASVGGTFGVTGNVVADLKFTDATYDIGKSGATRPRNIFASGTGTFAGTLSAGNVIIGAITSAGGVLDIQASTNGDTVTRQYNASTGASSSVTWQQNAGGRFVNRVVNYTSQYTQEVGSGITTRYIDYDTTFFRSTGASTFVTLNSSNLSLAVPLTYGGVTLSNSVTGTGSMVLSASPTFTGTLSAPLISVTGNGISIPNAAAAAPATMGIYNDGGTRLALKGGSGGFSIVNNAVSVVNLSGDDSGNITMRGSLLPSADNSQPVGSASFRWSVVYAGTGAINTSGRVAKRYIRKKIEAEARVANRIKKLACFWQFADAVEAKGVEKARFHFGVIAEDIRDAFIAEGLDPHRYAMFCEDDLVETQTYVVKATRERIEEVEEIERTVEVVDGKPVLTEKMVMVKRPVGEVVAVTTAKGEPVMVESEKDENDTPILAPMMHFIPEMEEYEAEVTREVKTGEKRLGLRYDQLTLFVALASEA